MFAPISLLLLVALVIAGVIQAFRRRYGMGILALLYIAVLFGTGISQSTNHRIRDIDVDVVRGEDRVEVRNRGPLAFTHSSSTNPYGGLNHRFRTIVQTDTGPQEVGFVVWKIGRQDFENRRTICPSKPGLAGIREMIDADSRGPHNTVNCSVLYSTISYMSAEGDGPSTTIRCGIVANGTRTPCTMRINHGRFRLDVFMWKVSPEDWRAVRDHIVAIVDQSFTIVDRK